MDSHYWLRSYQQMYIQPYISFQSITYLLHVQHCFLTISPSPSHCFGYCSRKPENHRQESLRVQLFFPLSFIYTQISRQKLEIVSFWFCFFFKFNMLSFQVSQVLGMKILRQPSELSVEKQTTAWPATQKHPSPSPFLLGFVLNDVFCRLRISF